MRIPRFLFPFAAIVVALAGQAQTGISTNYRQAAGNGPFPLYIAMSLVHSSNQSAFERMINPASAHFSGAEGRMRMWGYELSIGAIHNTPNLLWTRIPLHSASTEVSYAYLDRDFDDGDGRRMLLRQQLLAARIGYRFVVYYPITLHVQAGPVLSHSAQARVSNTGGNEEVIANAYERTKLWQVAGWDLRGRVVFFDPVGAAGGFSLFVEGQYFISHMGPNMDRLAAGVGVAPYFEGSLNTGVLSIGTTIPFALRIR